MPKEDITKIVAESKEAVAQDRDSFAGSIKEELESYKKKALAGL